MRDQSDVTVAVRGEGVGPQGTGRVGEYGGATEDVLTTGRCQ